MANDWQRAGEFIARRRRRVGYRTQEDFARQLNVSASTIGNLERGRRDSYSPGFLDHVEDALGWTPGSIERTVQGGRPRDSMDPYLARVLAVWPSVQDQTKKILVEWLEAAIR